jgi:prepilin-type N-terminal cleavage/methylation domain-containing protein
MKNKLKGFTLIEIMIALLLSTVVIGAIGKVFIDSSNSFRKQQALSYLVQDGRYAQEILAKEIRRTGFLQNRFSAGKNSIDVFKLDDNVLGSGLDFRESEYIKASYKSTGFNDAFDINHIIIRYQLNDEIDLSDNALSPCTSQLSLSDIGAANPAIDNVVLSLFFYVKTEGGNPVLYCKSKIENLINSAEDESTAIPLMSNVERFYISFGVLVTNITRDKRYPNTTSDLDSLSIARYLLASQVTDLVPTDAALSPWELVRAIKIYLVLRTENKNIGSAASSYKIDGRDKVTDVTTADKRLYKVFSQTLAFRNL